jgi:hypothetical protein
MRHLQALQAANLLPATCVAVLAMTSIILQYLTPGTVERVIALIVYIAAAIGAPTSVLLTANTYRDLDWRRIPADWGRMSSRVIPAMIAYILIV